MWWFGDVWCIATALLLWAGAYRADQGQLYSRWLTATLLLAGTAMAFAPLVYEFPSVMNGSGEALVVEVAKNGEYRECPWGAFESRDKQTFNVLERYFVTRSVTPITDNPKARRISYTIPVDITEPGVFFLAKPERWGVRSIKGVRTEVQKATEYWLYVFNNEHSKELAAFYNPLDDNQVAKFRELLGSWLDEKLAADGLKVRRGEVTFEVD